MYTLTARRIIGIALLSALISAVTVTFFDRIKDRFTSSTIAFEENSPIPGITDPSSATDEQNNIDVYRTMSPGVVFITSSSGSRNLFGQGEREGTGSGSIINNEGYILTNDHVVAGARTLTVSLGGERTFPARVIGTDPDTDLAVLKIEPPRDGLTVIPLGNSDELIVGQKVLAIGNPFGLDRTLTTGVISGLQRPIRSRPVPGAPTGRPIEGAIQTDASINPGNSGGPLLDSRGRMIGINSQILSPAGGSVGVGFAVPINIAKRVVPQLITNGVVVRPKLGISTFDARRYRGLPVQEGIGIYNVQEDGSAAAAGLRGLEQSPDGNIVLGDIIVRIDGEKVSEQDDLYRILDRRQINDTVQVEVVRGNNRVTVPVRLLPERRGFLRR